MFQFDKAENGLLELRENQFTKRTNFKPVKVDRKLCRYICYCFRWLNFLKLFSGKLCFQWSFVNFRIKLRDFVTAEFTTHMTRLAAFSEKILNTTLRSFFWKERAEMY